MKAGGHKVLPGFFSAHLVSNPGQWLFAAPEPLEGPLGVPEGPPSFTPDYSCFRF